MSKISRILLCALILGISMNSHAQYRDSLLRSAGFFISPGITNFNAPSIDQTSSPRFELSGGFRFKNELKRGFFIESGVGVTLFGASMPVFYDSVFDWSGTVTNIFGEENKYTQINLSTPFLAGYRTSKGKVRFEGAAGFAFNLRILQHRSEHRYTVNGPYDNTEGTLRPNFGTSFSFVARAGISIPIGERATIDILPTGRYAMIYFEPEEWDIGHCLKTEQQKWSAGIDIGLTWKLEDKEPQAWEDEAVTITNNDPAFTNQYQDQTPVEKVKPVRKKTQGPKNFLTNGHFSAKTL
jgi:hypothetical protein